MGSHLHPYILMQRTDRKKQCPLTHQALAWKLDSCFSFTGTAAKAHFTDTQVEALRSKLLQLGVALLCSTLRPYAYFPQMYCLPFRSLSQGRKEPPPHTPQQVIKEPN